VIQRPLARDRAPTATARAGVVPTLAPLCARRDEAAFLRACLLDGDAARASWEQWAAARSQLAASAGDLLPLERVFAGLVLRSAAANALPLGHDLGLALKAHRLVERRRWDSYVQVLRHVLTLVGGSGPAILARGAALAGSVYPAPDLRHVHDIDLIVAHAEVASTEATLLRAGFEEAGAAHTPRHQAVRHPSGMLVWIHSTPFPWPAFDFAFDVEEDSLSVTIGDVPARVLSPPLALLQACLSSLPSPQSPAALRWVTDAWFLIERADNACWSRVLAAARAARLFAPLAITLGFLAGELRAPVPRGVIDALAAGAAREGRSAGRDLARLLRAGPRTVREWLEVDAGWGPRLHLAICLAWPSRRYAAARRAAQEPGPARGAA
jgi:hypothetical protein